MDNSTVVLIITFLMVLMILCGVYVSVALGLMSVVGLWIITGQPSTAINLLATTFFSSLQSYEFGVIPLFVLMGAVFGNGLSEELFAAANVLVRKVRGGLAMATVMGNAVFAAITGSSMASAAAFSKISYPPMLKMGYDKRFALGTVAGSSILGMLIPPSILFIIYGILTQVSIGKLFIAGVIPGLLMAVIFCIGILLIGYWKPEWVGAHLKHHDQEADAQSFAQKMVILFKPWPVILLIMVVIGGIYSGYFTPNESAAVGAIGAIIIAVSKKQLDMPGFKKAVYEVGMTTGSIMLLLVCAQMYSRMVALSGLVQGLDQWFRASAWSGMGILWAFIGIILFLGCILDSASILLLIVPIAFPILTGMGFDPLWIGVVLVIAVEVGLVSPPFGMCVFTVAASVGKSITSTQVFAGVMPYLLMMLVCLGLVVEFPALSTWLVKYMN